MVTKIFRWLKRLTSDNFLSALHSLTPDFLRRSRFLSLLYGVEKDLLLSYKWTFSLLYIPIRCGCIPHIVIVYAVSTQCCSSAAIYHTVYYGCFWAQWCCAILAACSLVHSNVHELWRRLLEIGWKFKYEHVSQPKTCQSCFFSQLFAT